MPVLQAHILIIKIITTKLNELDNRELHGSKCKYRFDYSSLNELYVTVVSNFTTPYKSVACSTLDCNIMNKTYHSIKCVLYEINFSCIKIVHFSTKVFFN